LYQINLPKGQAKDPELNVMVCEITWELDVLYRYKI